MQKKQSNAQDIQKIKLETEKPYKIFLGYGAIEKLPMILKDYDNAITKNVPFLIITDKNVASCHLKKLTRIIKKAGYRYLVYAAKPGEKLKTPGKLFKLLRWMARKGVTRDSVLICFGGGVVGDFGGFASSIYMRGTSYIHIPTSLLAMVDSSIGGKTGIDIPEGKNLVGSFHTPLFILQDTRFLETLPEREFVCGLAEIIKAGLVFRESLFEKLYRVFTPERRLVKNTENWKIKTFSTESIKKKLLISHDFLLEIISSAIKVKTEIVREDEKEKGLRMLLNFGHTFAHGIETIYRFKKFLHGEAVLLGMQMATELSLTMGFIENHKAEKILHFLRAFPIPNPQKIKPLKLYRAMLHDKKRKTGKQYFILLKDIGYGIYESEIPKEKIINAIEKTLNYYI